MAPGRRPTVNRNPPVNRSDQPKHVDINEWPLNSDAQPAHCHKRLTESTRSLPLLMHENFCGTGSERHKLTATINVSKNYPLTAEMVPNDRPIVGNVISKVLPLSIHRWSKSRRKTRGQKENVGNHYNPTTQNNNTKQPQPKQRQRQQGCLQPDKVLMPENYPTAESMDDTTLAHALLLVTTVGRQDIRPKTVELHLVPRAKEDLEAKEDREVMSLVSDVARRDITRTSVQTMEIKAEETKFEATRKILRTIRGRSGENLKGKYQASTKQLKEDAEPSGSNRSFVSYAFSKYINILPMTLDTNYSVELADGKRHHYGSSKVEGYHQMARPTTVTEVRGFMGLAGYYRRYGEFSISSDALKKGLGCVLMQQGRILHDLERLDVELCVRGSGGYWASMRIESNLMLQIKEAQRDDGELWAIVQNVEDGKHTEFSVDDDGVVWFEDRLCVPNDQALREKVMTEAHSSPFTIHPGSTKMYRDLKQYFWWNGMKQDVATFVSKCMTCQQVKIEHQRASGLLQPLEIPMWKWDEISMDFVTGLPTTQKRHDAIWVVVDRLTKSAHFLPIRKNYGISKLAEIFRQEIVHSIFGFIQRTISRSRLIEILFIRTINILNTVSIKVKSVSYSSWDEYLFLVEFAYNNSWHASIKAAPICWDEVGERLIEGPELIEITNEKVAVAKEKLKEARSVSR
ncbi:retrotransposon protein, putative, ty3-gypsy subclass, partial [Tanacetum coccineum]